MTIDSIHIGLITHAEKMGKQNQGIFLILKSLTPKKEIQRIYRYTDSVASQQQTISTSNEGIKETLVYGNSRV